MQTAINPALAAAMTLEQAAQVGQFQPTTPDGAPTVAAQLMQRAAPSLPQIAQQAGMGAQIQAAQMQQAQQALMEQAMQQQQPQGIESLNPPIGNFAQGGIVGYAVAGMAEDEDMIEEPSEGGSMIEQPSEGGVMIEQPESGGSMIAEPADMALMAEVPAQPGGEQPARLPETGIAALATTSAPAIAEMRRTAAELAKMPVAADPRKAMEQGIVRKGIYDEFARRTGNDPEMVANQIKQMEEFYRRRDQQLERRYQETAAQKERDSLAQYLMNFRQMKGRSVGEGLMSASQGLARFQGGMDARMREIEDLRIQLDGLKMDKINSLKTLKYNTDMGFMNEAMKEQQRLIDNDRNIKKTEFEIAKKVAEIQSGEARTAAQIKERMERPTKAQNVYVKSTYTNAQGQRVAVMSDGSEKPLGSSIDYPARLASIIAAREKNDPNFRKLPEEEKKAWATGRLAMGDAEPSPAPAPSAAPTAAPTTMTMDDVRATAKASGRTEQQVIDAAKAKGITIK